MFPTTVWTTIRNAGDDDAEALELFAQQYRPAVLQFIIRKGLRGATAEDLCQDVFVRLLRGGVLSKADRTRGRFRSLLLTVASRVVIDHLRKHREQPIEHADRVTTDPEFDAAWAVHLADRTLERLREQGSPYHQVLVDHLAEQPQDRNKLWIAHKKLSALIRQEVAATCAPEEVDDELAYLARYLRAGEPASE